jgi:hypothetical protein
VFSDFGQIVILGQSGRQRKAVSIGFDDYTRDNSSSSIEMTSTISISRRWLQKLEFHWEKAVTRSTSGNLHFSSKNVSAQVDQKLETSLRSTLGISSEVEQRLEQTVQVIIPAGRRLTVRLHWKEIWEEGNVEARLPDGTHIDVPYRAAVDIAFDQENVEG